jgi:hypothetical protein
MCPPLGFGLIPRAAGLTANRVHYSTQTPLNNTNRQPNTPSPQKTKPNPTGPDPPPAQGPPLRVPVRPALLSALHHRRPHGPLLVAARPGGREPAAGGGAGRGGAAVLRDAVPGVPGALLGAVPLPGRCVLVRLAAAGRRLPCIAVGTCVHQTGPGPAAQPAHLHIPHRPNPPTAPNQSRRHAHPNQPPTKHPTPTNKPYQSSRCCSRSAPAGCIGCRPFTPRRWRQTCRWTRCCRWVFIYDSF